MTEYLVRAAAQNEAQACFEETRMMMFGYVSGQRGIPPEHYAQKGIVQDDSQHHQALIQEYSLESPMDPAIGERRGAVFS